MWIGRRLAHWGHYKTWQSSCVCVLVDSGCAEQVKFPPLQRQRDGKHREHAQVTLYFQQRWTLDREQTAGQQTGESCPPASLAIQNPGNLTGSRVCNSIKSSSHIIPSFWGHRSLFDANVGCKPQQRNIEPFTISWALRRDWTKKHLLLLRQHFKGGIYREADWTQLRPQEDVAGIR